MIILGVDIGKVRTGLAVCDKDEIIASPLRVVKANGLSALTDEIVAAAKENSAELIVLGLPRNMDGSEGDSAQNARRIGDMIKEKTDVAIDFSDERGTTITAHGYLNETNTRGKKRKAVVDAVAATIILQNYIDFRKNMGKR